MPQYSVVLLVLRSLLVVASAFFVIYSTVSVRRGRAGYRGVLLWALLIPVCLTWACASPRMRMSDPWHHVSHDLRLMLDGAFVTYGIIYVVPFLGRDRKQRKAERRQAAEEAAKTDAS